MSLNKTPSGTAAFLLQLVALLFCLQQPKTSLGFTMMILPSPLESSSSSSSLSRRLAPSSQQQLKSTADGQGGSSNISPPNKKTYDSEALSPRKDIIDADSAMREFFEGAAADWKPLFRSLLLSNRQSGNNNEKDNDDSTAAAMAWLEDSETTATVFEFHETSQPWQRLNGIPTDDKDRGVLAEFLDQVQASLMDIPVDETTEDDENDLHFLEEGRRMLVCGRFHVISSSSASSSSSDSPTTSRMDHLDSLFAACWNEIYHLQAENEINTGSLIVVPPSSSSPSSSSLDLSDLRRFVDINLQQPLQWLGLQDIFEVTSLQRGSPAIRLIHKLSDMPTDLPDKAETMSSSSSDDDGDGDDAE